MHQRTQVAGAVEADQVPPQHLLVEEDERRQRLVLRRGGDVSLDRQRGEGVHHFRRSHPVRMTDPVVADEATNPAHIRVFGSQAHVAHTDCGSNAIEQSRSSSRTAVFQGRLRPGPCDSETIPEP